MNMAMVSEESGLVFAGVDIGFGTGKTDMWMGNDALKFFVQSTIATGRDRRFAKLNEKFNPNYTDLKNQLLCMDIEILDHQTDQTRHVFIGKVAIMDGTDPRYCWDENKSSDEDSMALLIAQLATGQTAKAEGRDSKVTFYVGTGLPIKHYFQHKQAYEQNIKGDFTVIFRSGPWAGVKCILKIIRCQVYPQVWGIFWNETHDQLGNLINEQYRHGYTLVVDPGFGTTDYALFIDGVMKDAYCDSSELGIASAMKQVSENLAEKGVNLDEKELDHYFMEQDGVYIFNGEAIDLKTIREAALKNLGKKLYDDLKIKLQPVWDKIQVSLVGGGGGKALFNYLNLDNKQLVVDPQFGNASGFRKAAQGALLKSVHSHG